MASFSEKQKFNSLWGYVILSLVVMANYFYVSSLGAANYTYVIITVLTALAILFIFEFSHLDTKVTKQGISHKFWPYQRKETTLLWEEIKSIEITKYRPIKDYGGWGVRMGYRKGRAFNTRGNIGMLLHLKSGKDVMVGTQLPQELYTSIKSYNKAKVINNLD